MLVVKANHLNRPSVACEPVLKPERSKLGEPSGSWVRLRLEEATRRPHALFQAGAGFWAVLRQPSRWLLDVPIIHNTISPSSKQFRVDSRDDVDTRATDHYGMSLSTTSEQVEIHVVNV
jgi:hypothetical protein